MQFAAEACSTLVRLEEALAAPVKPRIGIAFGSVVASLPAESPTGAVFAAGSPLAIAASIARATEVGHIGVQIKSPTASTTCVPVLGIGSDCWVRPQPVDGTMKHDSLALVRFYASPHCSCSFPVCSCFSLLISLALEGLETQMCSFASHHTAWVNGWVPIFRPLSPISVWGCDMVERAPAGAHEADVSRRAARAYVPVRWGVSIARGGTSVLWGAASCTDSHLWGDVCWQVVAAHE
jgi:hypothetical protein